MEDAGPAEHWVGDQFLCKPVYLSQAVCIFLVSFVRDSDVGRVTYYQYELKNVLVTSYRVNIRVDASGQDVPTEEFSLNYEEIKVTYTETDSAGRMKGTVGYNWKVEEGDGIAAPNEDPTPLRNVLNELSSS